MRKNPLNITDKRKPTRFYSKNQEDKVAKLVGGRRTLNSGATSFQKGDVETSDFLIECKTSIEEKKSFSIKHEWLKKLRIEARGMGRPHYALLFNYGGYESENYCIISEKDFILFKKLLEECKE